MAYLGFGHWWLIFNFGPLQWPIFNIKKLMTKFRFWYLVAEFGPLWLVSILNTSGRFLQLDINGRFDILDRNGQLPS